MFLAAGLAPAAAAQSPPSAASIGGQPVASATEAPWSVHISMSRPDSETFGGCSGSIVDATHVLTAAHCTFMESGTPWLQYLVRAGITALNPGGQEGEQFREAVEVKRHPYYVDAPARDVALLRVEPPFDLAAANVDAIPVAAASPPPDSALRLFGWGLVAPGTSDGHLHALGVTTLEQWRCPALEGTPSITCTRTPTGSPCKGDSGGGFVGAGPTLFATTSVTIGPNCAPDNESGNVDLGSPEIRRWLEGDESPPSAPESNFYAAIGGKKVAGSKARCSHGIWSGSPTLRAAFVQGDSGKVMQRSAARTYVLHASDIGHQVECISIASNAGGTTEIGSFNAITVAAPLPSQLRAAHLVQLVRTRHRGERLQVVVAAEPAAIGRSARATWTGPPCEGCPDAGHVRLRKRTRLLSPTLDGKGPLTLRLRLPRIRFVGLTYRASTLTLRLPGHG